MTESDVINAMWGCIHENTDEIEKLGKIMSVIVEKIGKEFGDLTERIEELEKRD